MNRFGFVRVMAATPALKVGNCAYNAERITEQIRAAEAAGCDLLVLPELCTTGYTCGDLFTQETLLDASDRAVRKICEATKGSRTVVLLGAPLRKDGALYNTAAVLCDGAVAAFVPKCSVPNYAEFYEQRHFAAFDADNTAETVLFDGRAVPFGSFVFRVEGVSVPYRFGAEICEDLWVPVSPSAALAQAGAQIVCNLSASNEVVGKMAYRRTLVSAFSGKAVCAYVYCDAGIDESTTDMVFSGHKMIGENGHILEDSGMFGPDTIACDVDVSLLAHERLRMNTFRARQKPVRGCIEIRPATAPDSEELLRRYARYPFVPSEDAQRSERCGQILQMQAYGLRKRLAHVHAASVVVGISGGLDSTLALLVCARAMDLAGMPRAQIRCVTMPCFGTTDRTYRNAQRLAQSIGATLYEVPIREAVRRHFTDIEQDESVHDVTYENAQARERTQVLMDIANKEGGLVIGTGDLSELALGWATYNGDHMSMYGVNASIPKTLVRHLVRYCADIADGTLRDVLYDVLDTPVSPELLPPQDDGQIAQKTEELVGPYELHDFFLYYFLRCGFRPDKIEYLAQRVFADAYAPEIIRKWLRTFVRRFFAQQFKRSCLPDGAKVGTVALSPRGDWRMPSDADCEEWLRTLL